MEARADHVAWRVRFTVRQALYILYLSIRNRFVTITAEDVGIVTREQTHD